MAGVCRRQWHLDRNAIPANADCRGGVFAVFAKIPPPTIPSAMRDARPPAPRRYNNRGVPWVAWYAHGDGATGGHLDRNDILAMPTVGAGSSRFSRRFPRPPQPPSRRAPLSASRFPSPHRASPLRIALIPPHRASPLRIVLPSPRRPPHCAYPRIAPPSRIVYVIFAELLAHCLFLLVNSRYLCGVPRWWGINFIRLV